MQIADELSRRELSTLKEIRLMEKTTDRAMIAHLLKDGLIVERQDGSLQLSAEGRRMLVRGSPYLWDLAS